MLTLRERSEMKFSLKNIVNGQEDKEDDGEQEEETGDQFISDDDVDSCRENDVTSIGNDTQIISDDDE